MDYFPRDYAAARDGFCAAARSLAAPIVSTPIAGNGPAGESLTIDSVYHGDSAPLSLLIMTSGVHGVEGYAGSALQQLWLAEFAQFLPARTGALLVHALNPYGFAHDRRVNEHNVDLNRNALPEFPGPANPGYAQLNDWLNLPGPPSRFDDWLWSGIRQWWRLGYASLVQAIAGGQYQFPRGLFYGGQETEPSLRVFAELLADNRFQSVQNVLHLDLHSGLGRRGQCQLLMDVRRTAPEFAQCVHWFGADRVRSDHPDQATHYVAQGTLTTLTVRRFPAARTYAAVVEFGTVSAPHILKVLRAENRLHHYGCHDPQRATAIRRALRSALAPEDPGWQTGVIARGRSLFAQVVEALAECSRGT